MLILIPWCYIEKLDQISHWADTDPIIRCALPLHIYQSKTYTHHRCCILQRVRIKLAQFLIEKMMTTEIKSPFISNGNPTLFTASYLR